MKIAFLGTGAADWKGVNERGEYRRNTSTRLDDALLIDVNQTVLDQIKDPEKITDVFFTHSHEDHFSLAALQSLAPCRVYAHESWAGEIAGEGLKMIPLKIGEWVQAGEFSVLPMPANHSTQNPVERPLHYLLKKEEKTILYATDGAWLLNEEHHLIGKRVLSAAIFDATIGDDFPGDFRIFEHNSIAMVRLMVETMKKTGRLAENAPVYLTHFARTLHPGQEELAAQAAPFLPAWDGMIAGI